MASRRKKNKGKARRRRTAKQAAAAAAEEKSNERERQQTALDEDTDVVEGEEVAEGEEDIKSYCVAFDDEIQSTNVQKLEPVTVDGTTWEGVAIKFPGPIHESARNIKPTRFVVDKSTGQKQVVFDWAIVDGKYVPIVHPGLRKKDDGSYELEEDSEVQSLQGDEKDEVESLEEVVPSSQEDVKCNNTAKTIEKVQGGFAFESDQLSCYHLPDLYVPHRCISRWDFFLGGCRHSKLVIQKEPSSHLNMSWTPKSQAHEFERAFIYQYNAAGGVLNNKIRAAYLATRDEYACVWNSEAVMNYTSAKFISKGADCLKRRGLNTGTYWLNDSKAASHHASVAYFFEQHVACNLCKDRPRLIGPK